jgi:hypothetical protein
MGSQLNWALSAHSAPFGGVTNLPGAVARSVRADGPRPSCQIRRFAGLCLGLISLAAVAFQAPGAGANETDQSTLPLGREFADLKVPLSQMVQVAIVVAATQTNRAIQHSLWRGEPTDRTAQLQSVDWIAAQVWAQLFAAFPTNEGLDIVLAGAAMRARYPGLVTVYRPEQFIYDDPVMLLDVTKITRTLFRAGTINVDGTLLGTDKIIHFVHLGHIYYSSYLDARKRGVSEAQAVAGAVRLSAGYNPFLSENGFLGILTTGIRSNGDLAANYAGFKFYRNLTETVRIGDKVLPPMLVRAGLYWQIDGRVLNQPDFFAAFLTPHLNEALNPNTYAVVTDARVRQTLRGRCPDMLARYRDERGYPQDREQFTRIEQDLSTFYGEDYGYESGGNDRISVATVCFPQPVASAASAVQANGSLHAPAATNRRDEPAADRLGRTRLWWAARDGRRADVGALLAAGADPNAADVDGETPLHAAARWGHTAVVQALLAQGADPGATALYGMTPLHVAVEEARLETSRALLELGSNANARDMFGASPLHQAAAQGNQGLATLLLAYGADPWAIDDSATTPPQLAERSGNVTLAKQLSLYAASHQATAHAPGSPAEGAPAAQDQGGILRVSTHGGRQPAEQPVPVPDASAGAAGR